MGDPLSDCSPLVSAASSGKLRLVRLLVEGGAQVNGRNPRGETALLAACKALRGEPAGPGTLKLLTFLLHNKADPNAQDRAGRTALMYACMERAGPQVASTLLAAGADPTMEDRSGASALVYAINAQYQPTLKVLMEACQARGRDIIIIATEMGMTGGSVTRRYLNVPPSPDTSPVSCMSPSDIILKTGSPNSPEGDNVFNFRGTKGKRGGSSGSGESTPLSLHSSPPPRQRVLSEPWLAIHNLARLNRAYEEALRERSPHEEEGSEDARKERGGRGDAGGEDERTHFNNSRMEEERRRGREEFLPRISQSLVSLTDMNLSQVTSTRSVPRKCSTPGGPTFTPKSDNLPPCGSPPSHLRRNTLPSLQVIPLPLHLPALDIQSESHLQVPTQVLASKSRSITFLPRLAPACLPPCSYSPTPSAHRASLRPALLPSLPHASSVASLVAPPASRCSERSRRPLRRHSVQHEQSPGGETV